MQLTDAIKSRKSVKKFTGKSVNWKKVVRSLDLARFAPMAGNIYSLKFILVENQEVIENITSACQQDFVRKSGAVIVVVSDREKVRKLYDYNHKGFASQQAGAAIENVLLALTENKIDHCWVGFFDDNLMRRATKVPEEMVIEAIIPLGVAPKIRGKVRPKVKAELENLVFFDEWGRKEKEPESFVPHEHI